MKQKQFQLIQKEWSNTEKGASLVEVLLSGAILGLLVLALTGMLIYGQQSTAIGGMRSRASFLAEQGVEAVRSIRKTSYASLVNGNYGLAVFGGNWIFSGSSDITDTQFTRQITIADAGTNRKQVTSRITWQQNLQRAGSIVLVTEITNWARNIGNWALPSLESSFDLTVANSGNASLDGRSITFANSKVYLGRDSGGGTEFLIFDVSNPLVPALLGQRDLNGNPNDIVIKGNYAYIASDDNSSELQIVDISDPATIANAGKLTVVDLTVANSNNANANAMALATNGNYLFMIRDAGDTFLVFDLTNPASPGNPVGRTATITGAPTDVSTFGNYAEVSSDDNNAEFQIVDVTNKAAPNRIGLLDLNSGNAGADGLSVSTLDNYAVVGRSNSAAPELYSISISIPATPTLASTLELGGDLRSISYDSSVPYVFLITGDATSEFKVVDVSNPLSLTAVLGSLNLSTAQLKGVYDPTLNRVFAASSDNTTELEVIKPQ